MRDSDWSRQILLRSDWLGPSVASITTGDFADLPEFRRSATARNIRSHLSC